MSTAALLGESLSSLAGSDVKLGNVTFGPFHLALLFVGQFNVALRIDKDFQIQDAAGTLHHFDVEKKDSSPAATLLLMAIGVKAQEFMYLPDRFRVKLVNGLSIIVPLAKTDFDPIQLHCSDHMSPQKTLWGFTINAHM